MRQTWFNAAWLLSLMLGLTVAGVLAFSAWNRLDALDTAQQDQREWLFSQLEVEYLKLVEAVHYIEYGESDDLDELRKRFDVFYSRVKLAGVVGQSLSDPVGEIGILKEALDTFIPIIDGPDQGVIAQIESLSNVLESQRHIAREIALASIAIDASTSEREREQIIFLIETLGTVILIVTAFLIGAIYVLFRRSKSLRLATQEAEFNGARLNSMLRASLDAVIVLDEFGTILDLNGSAESVFKYSRDEMLDNAFSDLLIPERFRNRLNLYFTKFRSTGKTIIADKGGIEWIMMDKTSREFPAEVVATLARSDEKTVFIAYIRDITDAKEKEAEILQMRDEALAAYKEKSRFFAMMSHEMRTPLNGVISALQLLEDGVLDDTQRGYLAAAVSSGDILLGHINDVLAIERIETDDGVKLHPVDIAALSATMYGAMTPFADVSGVRLKIDQFDLDDRMVMTDPRALQQILVNLLSNAIKFSPEGSVTLLARFDPEQDTMTFDITDTGVGISDADVHRIFDDFVSLDSSYERRTGGTGLGLGIVKRQVNRLNGTITCKSTLGKGTVFRVTLPAQRADAKRIIPTTPPTPLLELAPKTCLIVDDNDVNRDLLCAMLQQMGHSGVVAPGGMEAIELAQQIAFDVILMDISMPGMNGMEATQAIKAGTGPSQNAPIIAVTAHALPHQRAEFRAAGMVGFIEKPVRRETLAQVLYEHCSETDDPLKDEPKTTALRDRDVLINMDQIEELRDVLGNEAFEKQVVKFLDQVDQDLTTLLSLMHLPNIRENIHALAGLCAVMGATQMHSIGRDIQDACDAGASDRVCDHLGVLSRSWPRTRVAFQHLITN